MTQSYTLKRGDTLSLGGSVTPNLPSNIATVRAMLRNPKQGNAKIADLGITLGPYVDSVTPRSIALFSSAATTVEWPVGSLSCDIEFTDSIGNVFSSPTFGINVLQDITYD